MARLILPNGFGHGWKPDTPDNVNDRFLAKHFAAPQQFADTIALDPASLSKPYNQGAQGSCTGHGTKGALEWSYRFHKGKGSDLDLSPASAYLNAREIEASVKEDSGAEIRDVVKGAAQKGVALSKYARYDPKKLTTSLTKTAQKNALAHQVKVGYYRCTSVDDILTALSKNMAVILGYTWYSCLSTADFEHTGVMPSPHGKVEGGHCNWLCYAHVPSRMFCLQNSYGEDFGAKHPISAQGGFVMMPFEWVTLGAADDIWAIEHE